MAGSVNPADVLTVDELAAAVGVEPAAVRSWQELGLLHAGDPLTLDDLERARLIVYTERRGVTPSEIAGATKRQGDILGQFVGLVTNGDPRRGRSPDDLPALTGLAGDMVRRLWIAAGLGDQDLAYDDDLESFRWLRVVLDAGLPEEALVQLVHVFADATGRLAEAESRVFHYYVHERLRAQGLEGQELNEATRMTTEQIIGLAEPALLYFHRKAFERALQEDFLLHLNEAMTPPGQAVGELTTSVMFVDLSGFTRLAEVMGDEAAARVIERFSALVRETLARHTGKTVKQIGDAFMLVFTDPSDAITYGADLMDALIAEPHFPAVRIGAHYGALLYREGDYIGTTVNVAARVANIAERNEFLITDALHRAASPPEPIEVRDVGTRALRGISGEVRVYAVERARAAERRRIFDPVCHMALTRESAAVTATWNGTDYFFCSADCAERFFADPEQVLTTDSSRA